MSNLSRHNQIPVWQFFSAETLIKALDSGAPTPQGPEENPEEAHQVEVRNGRIAPAPEWPAQALLPSLGSQLDQLNLEPLPVAMRSAETAQATGIDALFNCIRRDVFTNRDRLLTLNATRRTLVERRLEFIARKVARSRGERMNRTLSLPEILKETFRNPIREKTLGHIALERFASEVALHFLLQVFLLKRLDQARWRAFAQEDLSRVNFAVYSFLNQNSLAFTQDRHSWNFVRPNVYSWYSLSAETKRECLTLLNEGLPVELPSFGWSSKDLSSWVSARIPSLGLDHLDIGRDQAMADQLWGFVQKHLGIKLVTKFHGQTLGKKVFFPTLEGGGLALSALDQLLANVTCSGRRSAALPNAEDTVIGQSLWACEFEGLETFYTEVMSLLKTIDAIANSNPRLSGQGEVQLRVPHCLKTVQSLALELHNQEQLSLMDLHERALVQTTYQSLQGSAAQIQQYEGFDVAFVTDHPDRSKSAKWLKMLSEKLPYWRQLLGTGTNLNWGELHLYLALSKLKDQGVCMYLSHKVFPESGDGEKFRRAILGLATLDYFLELPEEIFGQYRYLYVFTRESSKQRRDSQRVRFGQWPFLPGQEHKSVLELLNERKLEESSSSQSEISERGWDQIFVRGAAPLVRHLNHKFPKLFQLASVQLFTDGRVQPKSPAGLDPLFQQNNTLAAITFNREGHALHFEALTSKPAHERVLICPHNPMDIPWLNSLLNSAPVQFWIRMQVTQDPGPVKLQDLRSLPVVDLTQIDATELHQSLDWLGRAKPTLEMLNEWTSGLDLPTASVRYAALAKRRSQLYATVARYRHLFDHLSPEQCELNPESVTQFYPSHLLSTVLQTPEIRVQYIKKEVTSTNSSNWIILDVAATPAFQGRVVLQIFTKQGPQIAMSVPQSIAFYMQAQLRKLKDFTWSEVLALLRVPRDVNLFTVQTTEITRVVSQTLRTVSQLDRCLEELSLDLFEIASEDRQYLR